MRCPACSSDFCERRYEPNIGYECLCENCNYNWLEDDKETFKLHFECPKCKDSAFQHAFYKNKCLQMKCNICGYKYTTKTWRKVDA